jgi:hypothetical protein
MNNARLARIMEVIMNYIVNNNETTNPGWHHEVHTIEHARDLRIISYKDLGYCASGIEAKRKAKIYYSDADGCKVCCPEAHEG